MGAKRKSAKPQPRLRSRTTRSTGKALPNIEENGQLLTNLLRAMGLYAADTLGDGNCLFRALSDQLYGTPSYHARVRQDVCDWIASHKERYAPFVDDERGIDVHLQCMRTPATYGGHLELSAFAHMTKRNVKVVQPGLVYVIEWDAGGDVEADADSSEIPPSSSNAGSPAVDDTASKDRKKRPPARERKRADRERDKLPPPPVDEEDAYKTIYVAYHDYEHFSSIRNLRGPHAGLPKVEEGPAPDAQASTPPASTRKPVSKAKAKPASKAATKRKARVQALEETKGESAAPGTPSQIPLPASRSPSLVPTSRASPLPSAPTLPPSDFTEVLPSYRSPKRTFDESSASSLANSESSQGAAKRAKSSSRTQLSPGGEVRPVSNSSESQATDVEVDRETLPDTPELSSSGSSVESVSSLSPMPSPTSSPPPTSRPERPLTRRQRKTLGLPKPRAVLIARTKGSAGKIIIPGGRCKKGAAKPEPSVADDDEREESAEWRHNGAGRVDVRGFRELRI
ncbi:cysteine proteinase [Wolfiporia cocos MD-104 SS10]|uniref:Cysteine proteinase n=1 Tax=Wolfiporia cocos (strain MD-104) TaxID=742152 RepID=A0A2H3K1P0_WOLCO|nr:cysteine proteinase [Wolfiporia cocos MD-104 SS10]